MKFNGTLRSIIFVSFEPQCDYNDLLTSRLENSILYVHLHTSVSLIFHRISNFRATNLAQRAPSNKPRRQESSTARYRSCFREIHDFVTRGDLVLVTFTRLVPVPRSVTRNQGRSLQRNTPIPLRAIAFTWPARVSCPRKADLAPEKRHRS